MKYLFLFILLCTITYSSAQKISKDELQDMIASETCSCIGSKDITPENYKMTFGLCVLEAAGNHQKEVDKYYGKDLMSNRDKLEEMGMEVGFKMASQCPDAFSIFVDNPEILNEALGVEEEEYIDEEFSEEEYMDVIVDVPEAEGKIVEIRSEGFAKLRIREESGKISEFIVLGNFPNAYLVTDKVLTVDEAVTIQYYSNEIYDLSLNKFITYNIITDIIRK